MHVIIKVNAIFVEIWKNKITAGFTHGKTAGKRSEMVTLRFVIWFDNFDQSVNNCLHSETEPVAVNRIYVHTSSILERCVFFV